MNNSIKPAPDSNVTVALVKRVSERLAKGIPLELALAGEPITQVKYEKLMRRRELAALQGVAKREFLEDALHTIVNAKKPYPNILWWLETFYPEVFAKPESRKDEPEPVKTTIAGMTEEELEAVRECARHL